jgi:hypothetical protein
MKKVSSQTNDLARLKISILKNCEIEHYRYKAGKLRLQLSYKGQPITINFLEKFVPSCFKRFYLEGCICISFLLVGEIKLIRN